MTQSLTKEPIGCHELLQLVTQIFTSIVIIKIHMGILNCVFISFKTI